MNISLSVTLKSRHILLGNSIKLGNSLIQGLQILLQPCRVLFHRLNQLIGLVSYRELRLSLRGDPRDVHLFIGQVVLL